MEEETRYKIETTDKREMLLMLNATRMAQALYDIIEWQRTVYNNRDYDGHVYFKGKFYTRNEWETMTLDKSKDEIITSEDRDELGFIKGDLLEYVYLEKDIDDKLEYILRDIKDFVYNYFE